MSTLYELTDDYLKLLDMAEDSDIDAETLADTMEAIEGELEDKADGYAKVMRQLEMEAKGLKEEIDRLTKKKKAIESSSDRIKKTLEGAMLATGKTKFKTELFSFGIQKNPASLKIAEGLDINDVPAEYIVFSEPQIDKNRVKEALKAGEAIEWATLEQSESLRIR